ncbi:hypothetical protein ACI7BZ_14065 [Xanthobacter sp. AM11]|uniref:hypothetical protein n=1 Tax=Xanthobacter sp. AM11 TaxID=3380643 RepID=UPI0039BF58D5
MDRDSRHWIFDSRTTIVLDMFSTALHPVDYIWAMTMSEFAALRWDIAAAGGGRKEFVLGQDGRGAAREEAPGAGPFHRTARAAMFSTMFATAAGTLAMLKAAFPLP